MEKVICSVCGTEEDLIIIDRFNEESVVCIDCINGIRKSNDNKESEG